jgi:predicted dithiol-disulfide oxidoreductase (DUF899 family)
MHRVLDDGRPHRAVVPSACERHVVRVGFTRPLPNLLAFRDRMGWTLPWVSWAATAFNEDFRATVGGEEHHAISVFLRDADRVFHTWSTYQRGEELFMLVWDLFDLTPYGRQETWEDTPRGRPQQPPYEWIRLHDS